MTSDQQRRERVQQGSRRQRDLDAAGDAAAQSRDRYLQAVAWAQRSLPHEHPPFAASAAMTIRQRSGRWPTAESVKARLVEQGRDMTSLERLA